MPWLIIILSYLIGSIPTAYISGHILRGIDIRQIGDGNAGAANAFRQLGAKVGITIGIIDATKGALAIIIAQATDLPLPAVLGAGAAAVIGHNWPAFLGFRGGRGESTAIGVLLSLITQPMLIVAGPALLILIIGKNVILASAFLFIPLPLVCWITGNSASLIVYSVALPVLVGSTHFLRTRQKAASQA